MLHAKTRITFLLLAGWLLAFPAASLQAGLTPQSVDASVRRAMDVFRVPGMAVAVVRDGEVLLASGYGATQNGADRSVDEHTLFRIGSVSKAFTTAALALLADDGKLAFDDRVIDHLPEFRMFDPWVTREFTIRDLLTHRSGLPLGAGDLLMFPEGDATRAEIVYALRYLKPSSSFRSKFDYDNLMYVVAGVVVERAADMPFEDFIEQRLLQPLEMTDCVASADRAPAGLVLATPHVLVDGELETTGARVSPAVAPAGGITCSARGMAHWMQFLLARGKTPNGDTLISEKQFDELFRPVTPLPVAPWQAEHAGSFLSAYALGWNLSTFYGEPMVSHGGAVWGMTSYLMLLPEQNFAVFASGNQMSAAPRAVAYDVADRFLAETHPQSGQDWIALVADTAQARRDEGAAAVAEAAAARAGDSTPSLPLQAYTGTYRDPWYGDVRITLEDDGRLWFHSERNPPLQGPLEHFQYDTFIARWTDRRLMADAYVSFSLGPEGRVERIRMKAVSPATDFSYDFHDLDLRKVE